MNTQIVTANELTTKLMPVKPDKNVKHRLGVYISWLASNNANWLNPDLASYRDHLLTKYTPSSANAHLSTVRANYQRLARSNDVRQELFDQAVQNGIADPVARKAFVDETITRLQNAIDPQESSVTVIKVQDVADSEHLRLTQAQANKLLASPGVVPNEKLRDTAIIALMLCTGIREQELVNLNVDDLRQSLNGQPALRIRKGKGCKQRLVPYGELSWCLAVVDKWLEAAGIHNDNDAVFWSFWRGGNVRRGRLSVRALQNILANYPIMVDGEMVTVKPHDLRRTYARRMYEAGMDLVAIQQNLGHSDLKTTLGYIGDLDADKRAGKDVYQFDLGELAKVAIQPELT